MSVFYAVLAALLLFVLFMVSVAGFVWFRLRKGTTTSPTSPRAAVLANPLVRQFGLVLLVVMVLWIVGSLVNHKMDNPMPYTIALALGALQYFTGSKKGDLKSAVLLTILATVLIWFWIHPQVLLGAGSSILEPFVTSNVVSSWGTSDISLALNVIMIGIVIRALWVTGDFFGAVFIVGAMTIGRMLLGI